MIEVEEGEQDVEVDVAGQILGKLVGNQPRDLLALHLGLIADSLNADEHLPKRTALDYVEVPLVTKTATLLGFGGLNARGGGQKSEEMNG